MTSKTDLEFKLQSVLNEAAKSLNLRKFQLDLDLNVHKGDGFLCEIYKATIEESGRKVPVIIKVAPIDETRREKLCIEAAYSNEIFFYSEIFPEFIRFQKEKNLESVFDNVPRYVTSVKKRGEEIIVLGDVTKEGFTMREKNLLLDEEHVKAIFETYGRFHAVSFCLKEKYPEKYKSLSENLRNVGAELGKTGGFSRALQAMTVKTFKILEGDIKNVFGKYVDDTMKIYLKSLNYKGKYSCILHGDCWSNNLMFKYQDSQIVIKILDFQMSTVGTPVHDLSYFFYSGGSKKLFDQLETFLDIYYESFSKFARELGSDPLKLLPRETLTEDWKQYSVFGMFMTLLLTQIKLMSKEESVQLSETAGHSGHNKLSAASVDENVYNERVRNLVTHMNEIGAL